MSLVQTKSLLAKLMAAENLHIEQRNVSTASFDVKNRVLTVPILGDTVTSDQYDLFMGHEVGHALYTPLDGMTKAINLKLSMSVMNVLEDSRIERKVKLKYPGIRQCFIRAYKELIANDFFGTANTDLNKLNFIDRVNLYCKAGIDTGIVFSDEEKTILHEIESTLTYDDVIEVCKKVSEYMKSHGEPEPQPQPSQSVGADEDFDAPTDEQPVLKSDERKDSKGKSKEISKNSEEGPEGESAESDGSGKPGEDPKNTDTVGSSTGTGQGGVDSTKPIEEPVSHTDEAWRKNEDRLYSNTNRRYTYGNVPDYNLSDIVIEFKDLWTRYKSDVKDRQIYSGTPNDGTDVPAFNKFREDSKKVVSYLVKEFEMKKNAQQMKRTSVAKTGDLNMSKIFSYQFSEDIFKRMSVVPDGKSHGLVMFIDWSGSMHTNIDNTIRQLLNLVMFCKKVSIPFEVYAFTQAIGDHSNQRYVDGDISLSGFHLMNLLSSQMNAVDFKYAASALLAFSNRYNNRPSWFGLSGTPLNEAIVAAMKIVPKFQKDRKLQIVNTVFLTDGDGSIPNGVYTSSGNSFQSLRGDSVFVIRDPITKHEVKVEDFSSRTITSAFIKLMKDRTKSNVIGFYIMNGRDFGHNVYSFFPEAIGKQTEIEELKKDFRDSKYKIVTSEGYDEYYLLRAEGLDTDEDAEFEVKENATTRGFVSAFSKFNNNRKANRVVLNRFIGMIT
jgi:hypothetical protein